MYPSKPLNLSTFRFISFLLAMTWLVGSLYSIGAQAETEIPAPNYSSRTMDLTGTLAGPDIVALNDASARIEKEKGTAILTLIVPRLVDESIEEFANRVISDWRPGVEGNAVLFVLAKENRKMRIEVGNGAQGFITDSDSKMILKDAVPFFKAGNFPAGISFIYMNLDALITKATPAQIYSAPPSKSSNVINMIVLALTAFAAGVVGWIVHSIRKERKKHEEAQARIQAIEDEARRRNADKVREELRRKQQEQFTKQLAEVWTRPNDPGAYVPNPVNSPIPKPSVKPYPKPKHTYQPNPPKKKQSDSYVPVTSYQSDDEEETRRSSSRSSSSSSDYSSSSSSSSSWSSSSSSSDYSGGGSSSDY
jgi:uncharacterized membrane protein YgcG